MTNSVDPSIFLKSLDRFILNFSDWLHTKGEVLWQKRLGALPHVASYALSPFALPVKKDAGVTWTRDPSLKAVHWHSDRGSVSTVWIPALSVLKALVTESHSHSLLRLPRVFVFNCLFQGDQLWIKCPSDRTQELRGSYLCMPVYMCVYVC